jgi:diguanylate cyclase (GGDEF)-like protein
MSVEQMTRSAVLLSGLVAITRVRTLRARVAVLFIALLAGVMTVSILVAGSGISLFARRAAERDMAANARVFEQLIATREDQMRESAMVVAHDFGFREAVALNDRATLGSALGSLAARTGTGVAAVVTLDGAVVTSPGAALIDGRAMLPLLDGSHDRGVIALRGKLALAVAAPIEMPDLAGWLVLAQPLDARDLGSLGRLSAVPINAEVATFDRLEPSVKRLGIGHIDTLPSPQGPQLLRLSSLPSLQRGIEPRLILRHSLAQAMEGYRTLNAILLVIALFGTLLGVWLSFRIAASITRPLGLLANATQRYAAGVVAKVEVAGDAEVAALARSFNAMVDAVEEREKRIVHTALHDELTGLPNRRFFIEKLDRAVARQTDDHRTLVVFIDLDDFKIINDTMGHPLGDELLRHASVQLQELFPDHMVARFGGDEFGLLVAGLPSSADCTSLARSIHEALNTDALLGDRSMQLSASFGIAIGPGDGIDGDTLLKNADLALYRAKSEGKGTYHFFEASLDDEARRRRQMELDLRQTVREGGFELHFQPLYSLSEQRLKGFEALIRWNHPQRGLVGPGEFIPLAEETGLIVQIGEWVIREACAQAAQWPGELSVAVNISPRQFSSPALAQTIVQALAVAGLSPSRLELEITESIFIGNVERTLSVLHGLRSLGVRIALDDFGTGYSSLSYLRSFPFDKLKIDQSFVHDLDSDLSSHAIIRAITTLAAALGIETLAEGVELASHMEILRNEGCDMIQGYLISRPVPASAVARLVFKMEEEAPRRIAAG